MTRDPFWGNLFRRLSPEESELFEILKQVPIFAALSRRELRKVGAILHRRNFAPDEFIVREGDMGAGMYVVLSGQVDILQEAAGGSSIRLATFGRGDFFGEQALLDKVPRTASALAVEPCELIGFFHPDLLDLIERDPHLGLKILMRLSQMISLRLRHTNRLLREARAQAAKGLEAADGKEPGLHLEAEAEEPRP